MNTPPFYLNTDILSQNKRHSADPRFAPALARLKREAGQRLRAGRITVVDKELAAPSGDPHDYYSTAPYWWPDPSKPDGLPYIQRDGEFNPDYAKSDRHRLEGVISAVRTLTLAWWFFDAAECRLKALELVRVFFLDAATRMNPHLAYTQAVPGRCEGGGAGIIDTRNLLMLCDCLALLDDAAVLGDFRDWLRRLNHWLHTHPHGLNEYRAGNNHGSWYDVQTAYYCLFTGDRAAALSHMEGFTPLRFDTQIAADGSQPRELARAQSFLYCNMNLYCFFTMARLMEHLGLDLRNARNIHGAGLRDAVEFMLPAYVDFNAWTHRQIAPPRDQIWEHACQILSLAHGAYNDARHLDAMRKAYTTHSPDSEIGLILDWKL